MPIPHQVSRSTDWFQRKYSDHTLDKRTSGDTIRQYCVAGRYFSTTPVMTTHSAPDAPEKTIAAHSRPVIMAQLLPAGPSSCGVCGHSPAMRARQSGGGTPAGGSQYTMFATQAQNTSTDWLSRFA